MKFNPNSCSWMPGTYKAKIIDYKYDRSPKNGSEYITWRLRIIDPSFNANDEAYYTTQLTGPGAYYLYKFLRAVDPTYRSGEFEADAFIHRVILVTVERQDLEEGHPNPLPRIISVSSANEARPFYRDEF